MKLPEDVKQDILLCAACAKERNRLEEKIDDWFRSQGFDVGNLVQDCPEYSEFLHFGEGTLEALEFALDDDSSYYTHPQLRLHEHDVSDSGTTVIMD